MKIAVCGAIIDTTNIYMIHEIEESIGGDRSKILSFIIESFNDKMVEVVQPIGWYFDGGRYTKSLEGIKSSLDDWKYKTIEYEDLIKTPEYIEAREKIESLREEVITWWGRGLDDIPKIGLDKTYIKKY